MKLLENDQDIDQLVAIIFGSAGVGKTWFCASASKVPAMQKVLLVDCDGGSRSIRTKHSPYKDVTCILLSDWPEILRIGNWLDGEKDKELEEMLGSRMQYMTLIIDNYAQLWHKCLDYSIKDTPQVKRHVKDIPSQQDYGTVRMRMLRLTTLLIELAEKMKLHLLITCHAEYSKNELDVTDIIRPALPGKLAHEVPGLLPSVGFMVMDYPKVRRFGKDKDKQDQSTEPIRVLHFNRFDNKTEVKDHFGVLGTLENPTIPVLFEKLGDINNG